MKGHQDQPQPDKNSSKVAAGGRRALEQNVSDQDQGWSRFGSVERQSLNDQRRADICSQHHTEGRDKVNRATRDEAGHHQARRGAALHRSRDAEPSKETCDPVAQGTAEHHAKPRAERPLDAGLHHPDAPQEQSDRARKAYDREHNLQPGFSALIGK